VESHRRAAEADVCLPSRLREGLGGGLFTF
jgi:hypothetical protein